MFGAILLDQIASRQSRDLVGEWLTDLNSDATLHLQLPFERTAGDEMEALVSDPRTLAKIALRGLQSTEWWIGIGIGEVSQPLTASVRSSRGTAFVLARKAIEDAKGRPPTGRMSRIRVMAEHRDTGDLQAAFALMGIVLPRPGSRQHQATTLRAEGLKLAEIAARLEISKQAASKLLLTAHWNEDQAGRVLVEHLMEALLE